MAQANLNFTCIVTFDILYIVLRRQRTSTRLFCIDWRLGSASSNQKNVAAMLATSASTSTEIYSSTGDNFYPKESYPSRTQSGLMYSKIDFQPKVCAMSRG